MKYRREMRVGKRALRVRNRNSIYVFKSRLCCEHARTDGRRAGVCRVSVNVCVGIFFCGFLCTNAKSVSPV